MGSWVGIHVGTGFVIPWGDEGEEDQFDLEAIAEKIDYDLSGWDKDDYGHYEEYSELMDEIIEEVLRRFSLLKSQLGYVYGYSFVTAIFAKSTQQYIGDGYAELDLKNLTPTGEEVEQLVDIADLLGIDLKIASYVVGNYG